MGILDKWFRRESRSGPNSGTVTVSDSYSNFMAFFGIDAKNLPVITDEVALTVPAVLAARSFLANSLANLPIHAFRTKDDNSVKLGGSVQRIINEAPNEDWTSSGWRKYMWQQVFGSAGRGLSWIERDGNKIIGIWPLEPSKTTIKRVDGKKTYEYDGKTYQSKDVIDIPFMLKEDQLSSYSPIKLGSKAIQLSLAMGDYASNFFAGGGVPPLALVGPMPTGAEAMKRAQADIARAIKAAKDSDKPIFPMPAGHELKPVGFDPEKGQMTDARRFQIEEIARIYNLPPVFLQDLTHGTFSNTEQQDLHLVKHLIAHWAKIFEDELNLKLFGFRTSNKYVEHSLDALQRGDFKTRMEGLAIGIQNAIMKPNEARSLENRQADEKGDELLIQGGTVPLGQQKMQGDSLGEGDNEDPPVNDDKSKKDEAEAA